MRLSALVVVGSVAGAVLIAPALGGTDDPGPRGARFVAAASSTGAAIDGRGVLDPALPHGGSGQVRVARSLAGSRRSVVLEVGSWQLDYVEATAPGGSSSTLVLRVRVESSADPRRCRVGTRGTVTLVDRGGSGDAAEVSFTGGRCKVFAREWSDEGGDAVDVRITLVS